MNKISKLHEKEYLIKPQVITKAPGVVRLLGTIINNDHGVVLQGALNQFVTVAISKGEDHLLNCYSTSVAERRVGSVKNLKYKKEDHGFNLIKGVVSEIQFLGFEVIGLDISIVCDIPKGVGRSSSSATCVAVAIAIRKLLNLSFTELQLIQIAYFAEFRFMGNLDSLIINPVTSLCGKKNHFHFFHFHTQNLRSFSIEPFNCKFYLLSSNFPVQWDRQELLQRKEFHKELGQVLCEKNLSDLNSLDDISFDKETFSSVSLESARRYCSHFVSEKERIDKACIALETHKEGVLGKLLSLSQKSLRDNYELFSPEVDWLIKRLLETKEVLGARFVGSGLGGAILLMVQGDSLVIDSELFDEYERIFGFSCTLEPIEFTLGASVLFPETK